MVDRDLGELFNESAQVLVDVSTRSDFRPEPIFEARRGGRFFATVKLPAGRSVIVSRSPSRD